MPYTHIQCIGYQVPTVAKVGTDWKTGTWTIPSGRRGKIGGGVDIILGSNNKNAYTLLGEEYLKTLEKNQDALNRVIRFLNVMFLALSQREIDTSSHTLKVFLAPEFYFRPEKPNDKSFYAYPYEIYKAIKEVLRTTIRGMPDRLITNNTLIVPGTIMWYMPKGAETAKRGPVGYDTYFNSCVYIRSQTWVGVQSSRVIEKARASGIDGVPLDLNLGKGASAPQVFPKYHDDEMKKHHFEIGGLNVGIEICLEHAMLGTPNGRWGVLANNDYDNNNNRYNYNLDLQLLTAGGMGGKIGSIVVKERGVFFRNDGLSSRTETSAGSCYVEATYFDPTYGFVPISVKKILRLVSSWPNCYLNSPDAPPNKEVLKKLPFDQQKIIIYQPHQIQIS